MALGAILGVVTKILPSIFGVIDKAVPDADKAKELKAAIQTQLLVNDAAEIGRQADIIVAEAEGHSWLQRNWRPMVMVWFSILVGVHWFGFTPENLTPETIKGLFLLVQIGLGGYVLGRSAEKVTKNLTITKRD